MADHTTIIIPLPQAVELLIETICLENPTSTTADIGARRKLANLEERESLKILSEIRTWSTVKNLSGAIVKMVAKTCRSAYLTPPAASPNSTSRSTLSPLSKNFGSPNSVTSSPHEQAQGTGNASTPSKRRRTLDFCDEGVTSNHEHGNGLAIASEAKANMHLSDGLLDAFEKLEFRKAFLILNYIAGEKLEDVLTSDKIQNFNKIVRMDMFEAEIWNEFGREICNGQGRRKYLDWDSGKNYFYQCHVDPEGCCSFKGPFLNKTTTLLQKVIGDENLLTVKIAEEERNDSERGSSSYMSYPAFNKVLKEGIFIGRRRYQFFVFKDGGKEEKKKSPTSSPVKCYFVYREAFSSYFAKGPQFFQKKSIREARSIFMHINKAPSLSNYMARFSLILSKTITLDLDFEDVNVVVISDVLCQDEDGHEIYDEDKKPRIHTDGTGFISEDLAFKCPQNCFQGRVLDDLNIQGVSEMNQLKSHPSAPPLLIQFRMFHQGRAIKGTVLTNRKLPPKTIQVRPSMIKVLTDPELEGAPTLNKFEIVGTSNKPKQCRLSKNLIALLHFGKVPRNFFLDILGSALNDAQTFLTKRRAALKVVSNRDVDDEFTIANMIASGIPLDEPFLQHRLSVIAKDEWKNLKAGKLPVGDSFYLMGTADPTRTLKTGEVCVILERGQISGDVLVYRNPGIHPGDIHAVKATYVKALEDIVGNSKYGIFFPSNGPRSMADEIAGGDYDGDLYWVSQNSELLSHFKKHKEVWACTSLSPKVDNTKRIPSLLSDDDLERDLFRMYLTTRFHPSKAMSEAADCWLVFMDRILTLGEDCAGERKLLMQKIDKLINKYYDALDAPKKGKKVEVPRELIPDKYPHHMERGEHRTYKSCSILGQIYDEVEKFKHHDPIKIWMLPCFREHTEQIPTAREWEVFESDYRHEMSAAMRGGSEAKNESAAAIYRKYKRKLYGTGPDDDADELDKSRKPWEDLRDDALAAYFAAYKQALRDDDPQKLNFAWKVAGPVLLKIFKMEQGVKKSICFAPAVVDEMFG